MDSHPKFVLSMDRDWGEGREGIRRIYLPALRHRVLLNFEAQAENIPSDTVLAQILNEVKEKPADIVKSVPA